MPATAYRYLINLPGVCAGRTIIEGTRLGVHDVIGLLINGAAIEDVLRSFPVLTKAQVYECLAYYEDHRIEIDALVTEQMSETLWLEFFLDHDVPDEVQRLLRHWGHEGQRLHDVLPITASDDAVFTIAQREERIIITCNRNHFLKLASETIEKADPFAGLIILIRRRTRHAECAHLLALLRRAGESGLKGNINLAWKSPSILIIKDERGLDGAAPTAGFWTWVGIWPTTKCFHFFARTLPRPPVSACERKTNFSVAFNSTSPQRQ